MEAVESEEASAEVLLAILYGRLGGPPKLEGSTIWEHMEPFLAFRS
jgi:hypothetical protein